MKSATCQNGQIEVGDKVRYKPCPRLNASPEIGEVITLVPKGRHGTCADVQYSNRICTRYARLLVKVSEEDDS